ncbi:hypothetical protein BpHYR1_028519 [Brachionus plicatilis]|uniref:Uncharacterized protein n=1 Tax=Brachionus plicatilis TaxID=10195 RepID=A0A3M7RAZ2_BRAPC|nr:hypothetical protein BpHYR1_028519 [Brachionus plicatilis]
MEILFSSFDINSHLFLSSVHEHKTPPYLFKLNYIYIFLNFNAIAPAINQLIEVRKPFSRIFCSASFSL